MTQPNVRKVQIVCFLLVHIPLVASVVYFVLDDLPLGALLAVAFPATLVAAIAIVGYIGHVMPRPMASG